MNWTIQENERSGLWEIHDANGRFATVDRESSAILLRDCHNAQCDAAELVEALQDIIAECPNPKLPYGVKINEIARNALAARQARHHLLKA